MMRSREEFVQRWKAHVAGVIALGSGKVNRLVTAPFEGAKAFGQVLVDLEKTTDVLLGQLYDDCVKDMVKGDAKAVANGAPPTVPALRK
jgi:hypothetical protein